jgi:hypothetical protein
MKYDVPPQQEEKKEDLSKKTLDAENIEKIFSFHKEMRNRNIPPKKFEEYFRIIINNNKLVARFEGELSYLLNIAIDELDIIEELNDRYGYSEEAEKKIDKAINKKINDYLSPIFSLYEESSFSNKSKIINFLRIVSLQTIFNNNPSTKVEISKFFSKIIEKEKEEEGNYYIFTHLNALKQGDEKVIPQISADQFIQKRYVNDTEKIFISDPKEFERIKNLMVIEKKGYHGDELDGFFIKELNENSFRPFAKEKRDNFFDTLFFSNKSVRDDFRQKAGFTLEEASLPEQYNFFEYTKNATNKEAKNFFVFLKKHGRNSFRTFLSIEQGGKEMGDKILTLGEKLPENIAQRVFEKYGEIIDNVNKITEFARNNFTKEIETTPELIQKIEETLYSKGKQLLSSIYDDIKNNKEINHEEIVKQLDRINADTITTFAIFKQAVRNSEKLPIESIEGSVFSKKEATTISKDQQDEMLELYETNWKNHPDRNFVESLKTYFKTAFIPEINQKKNNFYTFEKDDKIRAFVRFEEKGKNNLYASALNVDEASKNFGLGEAMMDEALVREAKENILHASCRKDNPSNMRYFEKGFISRGFKKTENTEEFDLVWDENKNKKILAKQKTKEELINMYLNTNYEDNLEIKKSHNLEELNSSIPNDKSLVRCFWDKGEWYAVYENVSPDYGVNFEEVE